MTNETFYKFAVIDSNNRVCDTIVFDTLTPEPELLNSILESKGAITAINFTDAEGVGYGSYYIDGQLTSVRPFVSWTWDGSIKDWIPPTPMPEDDKLWRWDEEALAWMEVILAQPE
jgi:hypothetical protein